MSAANCQVLLVDDHDESLVVLAKLLRRCSFDVQTARSFAEAMEAARGRKFDLLIADVGLPDRSGLDLLQELQGMYPVKGIALSGYTEERDVRASHTAGFVKHLNKPVLFPTLLEAIQEVVGWQPAAQYPHTAATSADVAWQ